MNLSENPFLPLNDLFHLTPFAFHLLNYPAMQARSKTTTFIYGMEQKKNWNVTVLI